MLARPLDSSRARCSQAPRGRGPPALDTRPEKWSRASRTNIRDPLALLLSLFCPRSPAARRRRLRPLARCSLQQLPPTALLCCLLLLLLLLPLLPPPPLLLLLLSCSSCQCQCSAAAHRC
jgi:hypothetical protein